MAAALAVANNVHSHLLAYNPNRAAQVGSLLGRGGFAEVRLAQTINGIVAHKDFLLIQSNRIPGAGQTAANSDLDWRYFQKERDIMNEVQRGGLHPCVISMLANSGAQRPPFGTPPWINYPYMCHGSLNTLLEEARANRSALVLTYADCLHWTIDILIGLEFLVRRLKMLHLDIKPHNILLDPAMHAIIADLGAAQTRPFDLVHSSSAPYAPPEGRANNLHGKPASRGPLQPSFPFPQAPTAHYFNYDVFSLGATCVAILNFKKNNAELLNLVDSIVYWAEPIPAEILNVQPQFLAQVKLMLTADKYFRPSPSALLDLPFFERTLARGAQPHWQRYEAYLEKDLSEAIMNERFAKETAEAAKTNLETETTEKRNIQQLLNAEQINLEKVTKDFKDTSAQLAKLEVINKEHLEARTRESTQYISERNICTDKIKEQATALAGLRNQLAKTQEEATALQGENNTLAKKLEQVTTAQSVEQATTSLLRDETKRLEAIALETERQRTQLEEEKTRLLADAATGNERLNQFQTELQNAQAAIREKEQNNINLETTLQQQITLTKGENATLLLETVNLKKEIAQLKKSPIPERQVAAPTKHARLSSCSHSKLNPKKESISFKSYNPKRARPEPTLGMPLLASLTTPNALAVTSASTTSLSISPSPIISASSTSSTSSSNTLITTPASSTSLSTAPLVAALKHTNLLDEEIEPTLTADSIAPVEIPRSAINYAKKYQISMTELKALFEFAKYRLQLTVMCFSDRPRLPPQTHYAAMEKLAKANVHTWSKYEILDFGLLHGLSREYNVEGYPNSAFCIFSKHRTANSVDKRQGQKKLEEFTHDALEIGNEETAATAIKQEIS